MKLITEYKLIIKIIIIIKSETITINEKIINKTKKK